jgi:hypothetical protein
MNSPAGKFAALTALFFVSTGLLAARPPGCGGGRGARDGCAGECAPISASTEPLVLSDATRAALQYQLDEERMAGELYLTLGEKHAAQPFRNIPRAEARHRDLLANLATRAGLPVPVAPERGRFATAAIQARYDALLARGQASLTDALKVGALVEEQDIADLRALAATTDQPELKAAIAALERGSQHHLSAFVRNLRARGVDYEAQVLPPAEVSRLTAAREGGPRHRWPAHSGRRATN